MGWHESRGTATAVARQMAHRDDAKSRTDDHASLRGRTAPRHGLVVPVVASSTVLLVLVVGTAVALTHAGPHAAKAADHARGSTPRSPAAHSSTGSATTSTAPEAGPVFNTAGVLKVTSRSSLGEYHDTFPLRLHVDCSTGPCVLTRRGGKILGGVTDRPIPMAGPARWHLSGRRPHLNCSDKAVVVHPDITITMTRSTMRLVVHQAGAELRKAGCVDIRTADDATFTGSRP